MRDASPTGGALGQVAVRELDLLQATVASLDQAQDSKTLIRSLEQVRKHIKNWQTAINGQVTEKQEKTTASEDLKKAIGAGVFNFNPKTKQLEAVE